MTFPDFCKGMKQHFGIRDANKYLDPITLRYPAVSLNILVFDDWLHEKFGMYEDQGKSMDNIITEKFSADASNFVRRCI